MKTELDNDLDKNLQTKLEKYEEKAAKCREEALKLSEGAQRTMYEVLADYYASLATDFRHAIEKHKVA